jgi:hypothetical protein
VELVDLERDGSCLHLGVDDEVLAGRDVMERVVIVDEVDTVGLTNPAQLENNVHIDMH